MIPLYLIVTRDEYRLPLIVCDSIEEMAVRTGMKYTTLLAAFSKVYHKRVGKNSKYEVVWVEED